MSSSLQNFLSLAIVAFAAIYLLGRFGLFRLRRGEPKNCGGCGNCSAGRGSSEGPLVALQVPREKE